MKNLIKKIVSKILKVPFDWLSYFYRQAKRMYWFSSASKKEDDIELVVTKLRVLTHEIDKGLSMPEPRKGFGKEKINLILHYMRKYLESNSFYEYSAYLDAREILERYIEAKEQYELDVSMIKLTEFPVDFVKARGRISSCDRRIVNNCENLNFKQIAEARHSVRYFKKDCKVDDEIFKEAVKIARLAPSACNRQSVRVKLINDKCIAEKILEIQGGTKGFANTENCVLIISDLYSYWYDAEMNTAFVDAGIFMMNLIYALKYKGIDSCPLIWDDNLQKREELNKILGLESNYMIVSILAVGYANEKAKILYSPRKDVESIIL